MKYEAPKIEVVRFQPKVNILTASVTVTESPIEENPVATEPYNPFA